jgi:hypothetical protein
LLCLAVSRLSANPLSVDLWRELGLDRFWREKLPPSREGTRWDLVLTTLALYRWLDPGSE